MPVETIHQDVATAHDNLWNVVWESGSDTGVERHDARLTERGIERVGRPEQIERRAQRDRTYVLILDHGGTNPVFQGTT